jgi:hypothetical protein
MAILTSKEFFGRQEEKKQKIKIESLPITAEPKAPPIIKKESEEFEEARELQHPDLTSSHTIHVLGIKLKIEEKEYPFNICYGRVATKSKVLYKELLKRGYIPTKFYEVD